ncbi:MAG: M48 family metallopeptidase [Planctomycetota bacterium]
MDFFEHQDAARRQTGRLVLLFVVAVAAIVALVYGVVLLVVSLNVGAESLSRFPYLTTLGLTAGGVLTVVTLGSLYKTSQLAGGGAVVAQSLGGREVEPDTNDPGERRLLNVVEEMAIASGTPVPAVYILDREDAINAFAAGWSPDAAVIGVTHGAVEQFTRAELQGVVAHEFSHILHGDMRLNLRLIGVIFGVLVISVIGAGVMRSIAYSGRSSRSNNKNGGAALLAILAAGLALYVIGYVGVFFGRLIQSAISRQREFLADAAAVQFTRDPVGIADALRRLGGYPPGSGLDSSHAIENSHLMFGSTLSGFFAGMFATHPPLDRRIRRIDPKWQGHYLSPREGPPNDDTEPVSGVASFAAGSASPVAEPTEPVMGYAPGPTAASLVKQIGRPTPEHLRHAHELIEAVPTVLRQAAHTATGAQAVVLVLLLDRGDDAVRRRQLDMLTDEPFGPAATLAGRLVYEAVTLPVTLRLPLLDLSLPALSRLDAEAAAQLQAAVDAMIGADGRVELFEWTLRQVLWRRLTPGRPGVPRRGKRRLSGCRPALSVLLTTLAEAGHPGDGEAAAAAFRDAAGRLPRVSIKPAPRDRRSLAALTDAVDELAALVPGDQRSVVEACAAAVASDGRATATEAELLRAVGETLGVPVPPLLPGQRLV